MNIIGGLIKEAIKKGEFKITLCNKTIPKNVKNALENNGYTVETHFAMNETNTTISWEEPKKMSESDYKKFVSELNRIFYKDKCEEKINYEKKNKKEEQ